MHQASRDTALHLSSGLAALGPFRLITDGSELPIFAATTAPDVTSFTVFDVARGLRERGWLVPAYTFPADRTDLSVLRFVIRNGFSHDLASLLLDDLVRLLPCLQAQAAPVVEPQAGFHH